MQQAVHLETPVDPKKTVWQHVTLRRLASLGLSAHHEAATQTTRPRRVGTLPTSIGLLTSVVSPDRFRATVPSSFFAIQTERTQVVPVSHRLIVVAQALRDQLEHRRPPIAPTANNGRFPADIVQTARQMDAR